MFKKQLVFTLTVKFRKFCDSQTAQSFMGISNMSSPFGLPAHSWPLNMEGGGGVHLYIFPKLCYIPLED